MQLTLFTDYALRVLMYAGAKGDRRSTCEEIASAYGISRHHLVKVINGLQRLGYVETRRGRAGGFTLARLPEDIGLGEVVRKTEGTLTVVECFDRVANTCPLTRACGLKGALREAFEAFFAVLDRYTLADLIARPQWLARVIAIMPAGGTSRPPPPSAAPR